MKEAPKPVTKKPTTIMVEQDLKKPYFWYDHLIIEGHIEYRIIDGKVKPLFFGKPTTQGWELIHIVADMKSLKEITNIVFMKYPDSPTKKKSMMLQGQSIDDIAKYFNLQVYKDKAMWRYSLNLVEGVDY